MHGFLTMTKRIQYNFYFARRGHAWGGQDAGTIGIRGKNAFATGTDNFRHDLWRAHNVSEAH